MSSDLSVSDVPITISLSQLIDTLGLGSIETRPRCQQAIGHPSHRYARSLGIDFLLEQTGNLYWLEFSPVFRRGKSCKAGNIYSCFSGYSWDETSTDGPGLSGSLDFVVLASSNARTTLSRCGDCGTLVDELSLVIKITIAIKTSWENLPLSSEIKLPLLSHRWTQDFLLCTSTRRACINDGYIFTTQRNSCHHRRRWTTTLTWTLRYFGRCDYWQPRCRFVGYGQWRFGFVACQNEENGTWLWIFSLIQGWPRLPRPQWDLLSIWDRLIQDL